MTADNAATSAKRMYRIDKYAVPRASRAEFVEGVQKMQLFMRTLEGLVRSFAVEQDAGPDSVNVMTIAEGSIESLRKAVISVREMHERNGTDRQANLNRLRVTAEQGEYRLLAG